MIPDRVSLDPASPNYWPHYRKLGVRIDGKTRPGDLDWPAPNHFDPSKRGFDPK